MQQYRVNYPLLIGLIVGTLVCSGAVYGLWRFQIERKSGWLISEARRAHDEHNYRDATQFYSQYLSIHSEDIPVRMEFANSLVDVTEGDDVTTLDIADALRSLENMLRNPKFTDVPEAKDVRRRLITLYGRDTVRNYTAALDHINLLLDSDPKNTELQVLRASYLAKSGDVEETVRYSYQLIGYDPKTDKFDIKKATAPHDPQVYATLAAIVRGKQNKPEFAERIVDQMIEWNPDSAQAYVQRGQLRSAWKNADGARADAAQAYRLKPDDTDVLLFVTDMALKDEQYDKANEYVAKAKKLHGDDVWPYRAAASVEIKQQATVKGDEKKQHYDKAMAAIDEGIKNVSSAKALQLQIFKAQLQLSAQDSKGARETLSELRKVRNLRSDYLDFFDAQILQSEGKWQPASEAYSKLRSTMEDFGHDIVMEINFNLALCYERLGKFDMAKDQYELMLQSDPQNEPAKLGAQRAESMMGVASKDSSANDPLQKAIADELKKPKAEQNWTKVDAMLAELAKKRQLDETTAKVFQAQIMIMREDFNGAAKLLTEAKKLSPNNLLVQRMIIQLARTNPKIGPAQAMKTLDETIANLGDQPALRNDKADILIQMNKDPKDRETLKRELANLFAGIDKWTVPQKVELWGGMAQKYLGLNMLDEARQYLALAVDNQPNELQPRLALFSLALEANDDAGMKTAQDKILQIVGDKNDNNYLYTEARRKLSLLRRGRLGPDSLGEIRALANQALRGRDEWADAHALLAEIELISNNQASALDHYDRAEKLGRLPPVAVAAHIRLLAGSGRFNDAGKLLDRIPEQARQALLGPLYAEILFRSNQTEEALKQARAATERDPQNAQNQYWYGQLLARSAQAPELKAERRKEIMAEAIKATQRATELQPEYPDAWFGLINYYAMQEDLAQAQKTMRDAQLAMSGDNLPMFLARSYEVLHRWFDAETMYREIYETAPDELGRAQQLAAFYLGPIYQREDRNQKVAPLLNQILKAGAENKIPANDGNLLWARRMAAKIKAATGEYKNLVDAEKLLASNSQGGNLLIDDKLTMAEILSPRPEPVSRLKAIGLLEEVDKLQRLNDRASIELGDLYYLTSGYSQKYKAQMEKTIGSFPNSVEARRAYATKLLMQKDDRSLAEAAKHVTKMRELAPNSPATFALTVRLAGKLGKQQQVLADLKNRLSKIQDIKELDDARAQQIAAMAGLLVELGDLDSAERIYTELAARNPSMVFQLAQFMGDHREPERCFAKLNEIYKPANVMEILAVAMGVVRNRRDKIGDKFDADVQHWLDAGLRENPDSIVLLMTQADLYDVQKKYTEAADVYRKLLARNDLEGQRRAKVLNNLAFLLALGTPAKGSDDPLKFVNEAAQIMGPNSDILDTRAVVLYSQKDYKGAIQDLELAVTDTPTPSKYYHKAIAHLGANENKAASEAWGRAEALGLSRDSLNRMEYDQYEEMKKKIQQIRQPNVTRASTSEKAA